MWLYEEEQKCLEEMATYPLEIQIETYQKGNVERVINNLFTFNRE